MKKYLTFGFGMALALPVIIYASVGYPYLYERIWISINELFIGSHRVPYRPNSPIKWNEILIIQGITLLTLLPSIILLRISFKKQKIDEVWASISVKLLGALLIFGVPLYTIAGLYLFRLSSETGEAADTHNKSIYARHRR